MVTPGAAGLAARGSLDGERSIYTGGPAAGKEDGPADARPTGWLALPTRPKLPFVNQIGFRARLFFILLSFSLIPTIALSVALELPVVRALPLLRTPPSLDG